MARKIILLSDGTGNSAAKVWRTNVWRVFECLDLTGNNQIAAYDDGVGTASFKPLAVLGGAFGFGLKRNVIDLYKFACRNYRAQGDEIYGFGFSRGAFTMRIVIALILDQGLIRTASDDDLHRQATAAYRAFRAKRFHTKWPRFMRPERFFRFLRDLILRSDYSDKNNIKITRPKIEEREFRIRFLGLWDTVAAYGMPIEEMATGMSQWLWPWMLPDYNLDPRVERACHALSVDDERTTFHPTLWDESHEAPLAADADGKHFLRNERVSQVWFPGVHSNVGGGYPDDSLAQIPLIWILSEAQNAGLAFKTMPAANPQTYEHPGTIADKDGRIYDPRSGLGGYYRYGPRNITILGEGLLARQGGAVLPRIHESVLKRIQNRAHSYAPVGLPPEYEVVTATGEVLPPANSPYERPAQARARWNYQEKIWNYVWFRRLVYFVTVGISVYLFAFPLLKSRDATAEFTTRLRWVSDLIRLAEGFLPGVVKPWFNGYARAPFQFVIVAGALVISLYLGSRLAGRIQNRMDLVWQGSLGNALEDPGRPSDLLYRIRTSAPYRWAHWFIKVKFAPALFALVFAWLGLTFASHGLYVIQDDAGWVCRKSDAELGELSPGEVLLSNGKTAELSEFENKARTNAALSEEEKKNPFKYIRDLPVFSTSDICQSMKVKLDRNRMYLIRFENTDSFRDGTIKAAGGYYTTDAESLWEEFLLFAGVPLRRELTRPWFRVVARIGPTGGEESFLDPDAIRVKAAPSQDPETRYVISEKIKATRNGELFLFVNDAVIGLPYLYDVFYRNNKGETRVLVFACRSPSDPQTGFHC